MRQAARANQRGIVLLVGLGVMALLALIGTRLTSTGRVETQIARNALAAAMAEAAADGAVHEAIFRLRDRSPARWKPDGAERLLELGNARVAVRVLHPGGFLNPNTATPPLMAALIREVGGDANTASAIAAAIFDWRTPGPIASTGGAKLAPYRAAGRAEGPSGSRFASIDEMGAVLGMTPALLTALRPYMSLHNFGPIDPARAAPALARALKTAAIGQPADDDPGTIVLIGAVARLADDTRFVRRAAVLLDAGERPFKILSWESGDE